MVQPSEVGLFDEGKRRVRGLRREEVAMLAGISTDYYNRLEQGRERHPSPEVVAALARVLGLGDDSMTLLRELARPAHPAKRSRLKAERVGPGLLGMLQTLSDRAVLVQNRFRDVLACTELAAALHPGLEDEPNMLRLLFLNPAQRELYSDWEAVARESVAWLRSSAGADVDHPRLVALVGDLALRSDDFGRLWARHDVRTKSTGRRHALHPLVGRLTVSFETFAVNASPGQFMTLYHTEPNSSDSDAMALLARHAAEHPVGQFAKYGNILVANRKGTSTGNPADERGSANRADATVHEFPLQKGNDGPRQRQ